MEEAMGSWEESIPKSEKLQGVVACPAEEGLAWLAILAAEHLIEFISAKNKQVFH